jgi:hypothetical protein
VQQHGQTLQTLEIKLRLSRLRAITDEAVASLLAGLPALRDAGIAVPFLDFVHILRSMSAQEPRGELGVRIRTFTLISRAAKTIRNEMRQI